MASVNHDRASEGIPFLKRSLSGGTSVLSDLQDLLPADQRYDYVFEGNSQTLDHVLVTDKLLAGAQFDVVRINAEFAIQTSDHDPLLALFTVRANDSPDFTSPDAFLIAENQTGIGAVVADDPEGQAITYAIAGGADTALFSINPVTGQLSFKAAPDFESPEDAGADNVYNLEVSATDALGASTTRLISVSVTDVIEPGLKLVGTNANNTLNGGTGDDVVSARDGKDLVRAGDGDDIVYGGAGNDTVEGGRGDDVLYGQTGDDLIKGDKGDDILSGGEGKDTLNGGAGYDIIEGGAGQDEIDGGDGDDTIEGGAGSDEFIIRPGAGDDLIVDFAAVDRIRLVGGDLDTFQEVLAATTQVGADIVIALNATDSLTVLDYLKIDLRANDFVFA
jgi:Ca2+-binding RTX toxin-like protein